MASAADWLAEHGRGDVPRAGDWRYLTPPPRCIPGGRWGAAWGRGGEPVQPRATPRGRVSLLPVGESQLLVYFQ